MDSLIAATARALAAGDPVTALQWVALRRDPPALALRGIAMAQLGDLARARMLLRRAARGFGAREVLARARCVVAEADIALAARDLRWPARALRDAAAVLRARGDRVNAAYAQHLAIRRLTLIGQLDAAERASGTLDVTERPAAAAVAHDLVLAGIAMRRLRIAAARQALARADTGARRLHHPALSAEVAAAMRTLAEPAARLLDKGRPRLLRLDEVEALFASGSLVVDVSRRQVRHRATRITLAGRPVLLALARTLAEAWPDSAARDALIASAFASRCIDESHRARLRVEIGRLRRTLRPLATITATRDGFVLTPRQARNVVLLTAPDGDEHAALLTIMGDGEAWSSSALAVALGTSQRTVQRALDALGAAGRIQASGQARARRWVASPLGGIAPPLLLPPPFAGD